MVSSRSCETLRTGCNPGNRQCEVTRLSAHYKAMVAQLQSLDGLSAVQLRELTVRLAAEVIDKLTNENALLKRMKFAAQSERFSAEQFSLLDGLDIEDLACESEAPPAP